MPKSLKPCELTLMLGVPKIDIAFQVTNKFHEASASYIQCKHCILKHFNILYIVLAGTYMWMKIMPGSKFES